MQAILSGGGLGERHRSGIGKIKLTIRKNSIEMSPLGFRSVKTNEKWGGILLVGDFPLSCKLRVGGIR